MVRRLVPLTAAALALIATAPAEGATVRVVGKYLQDDSCRYAPDECAYAQIQFRAVPGERNVVAISKRSDGRVEIADADTPVRAGARCEQLEPNRVACQTTAGSPFPSKIASFDIELGDRADRLTLAATGLRSLVKAGPGDDTVVGSSDPEFIQGAGGRDRLTGAAGADSLQGGSGKDLLTGGEGSDSVEGGTGDDRLAGDAGRDRLVGGGGEDRLRGGVGNDNLQAYDRTPDTLDGGDGRDAGTADRIDRASSVEKLDLP